ncbi:sensor domain-containing protein [Pseudoalteromonas xiamenensis]|uniref:sensor domain-containing protein n=1 Tax=Pseudoalteromonas xiamenensis TaxID=882626 RepID=UPI0027E56DF8|nr:sensor domain-containing protein [Pseudoalteromonas xiamenensis]WMN60866.1 sensor domain-containing protein [Pseudoalteromonas xiamenensis]
MRYFSLFEGRLVEALLGTRMPRRPVYTAKAVNRMSIKNIVKPFFSKQHWTAGLYFVMQLPLAVFYLVSVITPLLLAVVLFLSPLVDPIVHALYPTQDIDINWYWFPLTTLSSIGLLALSLTLAKYFGQFHGKFAKAMLVAA